MSSARLPWGVALILGTGIAGSPERSPVAWHDGPGCRWAELAVPPGGKPGFTLLDPAATGVTFTNVLAETTSALNRIPENGSGVALGDVDGDGWCDIYLCRLEGDNALFRNLGGWRFENVTAAAGVACPDQYSTGAALADTDGDGDLDLLVNSLGGGTRSFSNDGRGRFTEITGTRLVRRFASTSLALADIDGDGDLDLYVTNYRATTYLDRPPGLVVEARMIDGRIVVSPEDRFIPLVPRDGGVEVMEKGERDFLYLNDGRGQFLPVSWTSGSFLDEEGNPLASAPQDWGLSVMLRDLTGDGAPDLYVCNDFFFFPDRMWLNEGGRSFRAPDRLALRHQSVSSMGMDVADLNRDGHDDLFVTDMVSRNHAWRQRQRPNLMKGLLRQPLDNPAFRPEVAQNTLFLNRGDNTYVEIAQLSGVDFSEWSWGAVFLDVDLDGYEDLIIPTGNNHDVQDADTLRTQGRIRRQDTIENRLSSWRQYPVLATPILGYRNQGDLTFSEQTAAWGFGAPGPWQGLALADLDNDGDLDCVVNRLKNSAGLYRNDSSAPRLAVRLKGTAPNTRGITARITVEGGPVTQTQEIICGGRYLSSDDPMRVFAAGTATNRLRLDVRWRSGRTSRVPDALPNRVYEIDETAATASPPPGSQAPPPAPRPFFEDVSDRIGHVHRETPFDDLAGQPLLSRSFATLGPGIAWYDLDGDGADDLLIGGGRGSTPGVYRGDGHGRFAATNTTALDTPRAQGRPSVVVFRTSPANATLCIATASTPGNPPAPGILELVRLGPGSTRPLEKDLPFDVGPLALGDVDGDGDLDLFAGGRLIPGRYPEPAPSRLYRTTQDPTDGPAMEPDDKLLGSRPGAAGLVSGATFTDLTGDGFPELALACEWGPIRLFKNTAGRLAPWNPRLIWAEPGAPGRLAPTPAAKTATSLDLLSGWWNGVAAGDFDGDGRLDLALSGWGRNTRFQRFLGQPLRLYAGEFAGTGGLDLVEAVHDPALARWVPWRDYETMARALPFIVDAAPTFKAYGLASVEELLGDRLASARILEAVTLDSLVLLNRDDHFLASPLPVEAQFAPAFGISVADFDGDGAEDLFLSQNFFDVESETVRYDGGLGLWLRGDGRGAFSAVRSLDSGLRIQGQQRGCAVSDFDGDGRPDLAVAQHNGATRLYHNRRGAPGLRVRLQGPPGNPDGIGAVLRVHTGDRWGPAREIRAGSGYWSQDSATPVLARPLHPARLEVRWPGGRTTTADIPDAAEFTVGFAVSGTPGTPTPTRE